MRLLQSGKCASGGVHGAPLVWKVSIWIKKKLVCSQKTLLCVHGDPLLEKMDHGRGPVDIQKCVF